MIEELNSTPYTAESPTFNKAIALRHYPVTKFPLYDKNAASSLITCRDEPLPPLEIIKSPLYFYSIINNCLQRQNELNEEGIRQLMKQIMAAYQRFVSRKPTNKNFELKLLSHKTIILSIKLTKILTESPELNVFAEFFKSNFPACMKDTWWIGEIICYAIRGQNENTKICFYFLTEHFPYLELRQFSSTNKALFPRIIYKPITNKSHSKKFLTNPIKKGKVIIKELPSPSQSYYKFTKGNNLS